MHGYARRLSLAVLSIALSCIAAPALAQAKVDLAIFHPERAAWTAPLKWWIEEVDKATQGRVKFTPHFAGSLVTVVETLKAVRDGSVPAGVTAASFVSGQMPYMAYLEALGGMPAETGKLIEVLNALRPVLEVEMRKTGVEYLWSQGSGSLISFCRDRHLRTAADYKNRKIRAAGRWQAEQLRALGASPVATDPSEQYIALQNRTIDCSLSVNILGPAFKLHEVAPKVTQMRVPVNLSFYIMNKGLYDKISEADRAAIRRLSIEGDKRSAEHVAKVEIESIALMNSQKADMYTLNAAEYAELRKAIAPAFAKMDGEGGEAGKQIADIVKRYW